MEKIRSMLKSPQGGSFNLIGDTYIKTPTHDEVMKCLDPKLMIVNIMI